MTIETTIGKVQANGNGVATVFSFTPVTIFANSHLVVTKVDANGTETVLSEGSTSTTYSLTLDTPNKLPSTGSITYPASGGSPLPTGARLIMTRMVPLRQNVDLENQGGYFPDTQEDALDYAMMVDIQQQTSIDRSVKTTVGSTETPEQLLSSIFTARDTAVAAAATATNTSQLVHGTSTTSLLIGTGSKTWTTQASLAFTPGMFVVASSDAGPTNYMHGQVTSYSGTTLIVNVSDVGGSGTFADWTINVSGSQGPIGATGPSGPGTGDVTGPASSVNNRIAVFNGTSGKIIADGGEAILATMVAADITGSDVNRKIPTGAAIKSAIDTLSTPKLILLTSGSHTGTALSLDIRDATSKHIEVRLSRIKPTTDAQKIWMRTATDTVPTFAVGATDYQHVSDSQSAGGLTAASSSGDSKIVLTGGEALGNGTNEAGYLTLDVYHPVDTDDYVSFTWRGGYRSSTSGRPTAYFGFGGRLTNNDVTFLQFLMSGGGSFTCKYEVYAIR